MQLKRSKGGSVLEKNLSPVAVWGISFGCAVGWGAFVMPGTTFLPVAGPLGTCIGIMTGGLVMLIIAANYHYMTQLYPDAGGTYTIVRETWGYDSGFLCAWFLQLVYMSIAWANATALPLVFRNLYGGLLQFGFHYRIAGYDVYMGEALVSLAAIWAFGFLCIRGGKWVGRVQAILAFVLLGGIIIGFIAALSYRDSTLFHNGPLFGQGDNPEIGVLHIIALTPWAFVGFEAICHASEEYGFSHKKSFGIMFFAIICATFCYVVLVLIAASVLPKGYSGWMDYIHDLDKLSGVKRLPVFYAIKQILGERGSIIFAFTLLGGVFTGILGNMFMISRLMLSLARDRVAPKSIEESDESEIPGKIIFTLMLASIPIPFLGRSVIGWIVDIATIGAAIAYLYTSASAYKAATQRNQTLYRVTGIVGIVCSIFIFLYYMVPNMSAVTTLSTESYLILVVWSIVGFMFFRDVFKNDKEDRFGNSTVVWVALLFLIFFTTTLWTRQVTHSITEDVLKNHAQYHKMEYEKHGLTLDELDEEAADGYMSKQMEMINSTLLRNSFIQMGLVLVTLLILISLYALIMRRQKRAADDLLKTKNDFLANMSHELRTPINTILGMDEMIIRETGEANIEEYASHIQRAGNMLITLINDVLDFSKIEAGKLELVPEDYDLPMAIVDMVSSIDVRAEKKGLEFHVNVDPDLPVRLRGDYIRMRQVVLNLLTNAVKYTEKGSASLSITGDKEDENHIMIHVSVVDTGIGIREEDMPKLYDAFTRFDEGRNRTIEGTGLGMTIVRELLDLMDSRLKVTSVYGVGSSFSFDVLQEVLDWTPIGDFNKIRYLRKTHTDNYSASFKADNARVLVVDDTEMNLFVIKGLLKDTNLLIDTATDGAEGLKMCRQHEYDIIMIDHRMPVMDGVEMLHTLREAQDNPNRNKPCIALTANAGTGAREEYIRIGFDEYMVKPVDGKRLEEMIIAFLPKDKITTGDKEEGSDEAGSDDGNGREDAPKLSEQLQKAGINMDEGLEYAGSMDMYIMTLRFFKDSADAKRREIMDYYECGDWDNYVTKVHGLKSSARVIGAEALSDHARLMEIAGNKKDMDYIRANYQSLMDEYDKLKDDLFLLAR